MGARVAGATLAALLGDAGLEVLLVDRARFPSTTCSTHFFRGGGLVGVLERLGVLGAVLELGSPPLRREWNYDGPAGEPSEDPPQNPGSIGYALSVRREPLDLILTTRARSSSGVTFAEQTVVTDVLWEGASVVGVQLDGHRTVRARLVVGADGRNSLIARRVGAAVEEEAPASRALYYRYAAGFQGPDAAPADAPEFSLVGDELAYIFPSDSDLTCVAVSVNLETFRWLRESVASRFEQRIAAHQALASRVAAARAVGRVLGCGPERSFVRVPHGGGWALVGDAALHQDPWTGLGMDMAGVHATFLAEAIIESLGQSTTMGNALAAYHERRNEHALEDYRETVRFGADLRALATTA